MGNEGIGKMSSFSAKVHALKNGAKGTGKNRKIKTMGDILR